jgi:hypothetical protein
MITLSYKPLTRGAVRLSFQLESKDGIVLPGVVLERDDPGKRDRYYTNFAGKFPWEVEANLPPFRFFYEDRDVSHDLFFGVPQFVLRHVFEFTPQNALRYQQGTFRNCGNCTYKHFRQETWDTYQERSTSERYEPIPSFYVCSVTGSPIDRFSPLEKHPRPLDEAHAQLKNNSCESHTRAPYQAVLSVHARKQPGDATAWVPAEQRRLQTLNPEAIHFKDNLLSIAGVPIRVRK